MVISGNSFDFGNSTDAAIYAAIRGATKSTATVTAVAEGSVSQINPILHLYLRRQML